jgi:hypothetical protein
LRSVGSWRHDGVAYGRNLAELRLDAWRSTPGTRIVNARLTIRIKLHLSAKSIFENFR